MKWTVDEKSKFTVFVLCSNVDKGAAVKTAIAQEGFDTFLFTDAELLYERMRQAAPHLVVLTHGSLAVPLDEFVQVVVDLNSEIRFLAVIPGSAVNTLLKFRPYNFANVILEGDGIYSRIVWSVDEICQSIFLTYQNEQIFQLYEKAQTEVENLVQERSALEKKIAHNPQLPIFEIHRKYLACKSKDEVLSLFFRELNQSFLARNKKVISIYFKFLPSVSSFVALQSLGIEIEGLKGVGCRLTEEEAKDPVAFFEEGGIPSELTELLKQVLGVSQSLIKPVQIQTQLDGFVVFWSKQEEIANAEVENELSLFAVMYEHIHLAKKLMSLDLADEITELYGRNFYLQRLNEEVARARRLQKAVSVIKISIDHFPELQQTAGRGGRDQILRAVGNMIQKTSRVNDLRCRTGENEFSLILPHSPRKGASIRAERLRRMVEAFCMKWTGIRFSISCGVGEYPSHCSSADDLEIVSGQALEFISGKGGNKVCLFQPSNSFRPEFEVPAL